MAGKRLTPKQISEAVTLREAGYTLVMISDEIGVSVSSLQRAFKRLTVKKGTLQVELVERAREKLLERLATSENIKQEAARLVADDLAHANLIRGKIAVAAESLNAKDTVEAALVMRAAAAYSTALKNTSEVLRRGLRLDERSLYDVPEDLPELIVRELTEEDIAQIKKDQADQWKH